MQDGKIAAAAGNTKLVSYFRSSAKPFQALPLVRARPDLEDHEIAIACASHQAEPAQLDAVRSLLAKAPATEDDLECGEQEGRLPGRINHNCSGKHAGFLALCRARGWATEGYRLAAHPLQQHLLAEVAAATELRPEEIPTAVDGCGVLTFGLSLEQMAASFARLAAMDGADRVLAAMRAHPELVGGESSLDTVLMQALPGWVAKRGAEGLLCGVSPDGLAIALKSEDGNPRPLAPALAQFLATLGVEVGEDLATVPVENSRGEVVGEVAIDLTDAAAYEEKLRKIWVGEPPQLQAPIEIRDYDPSWPQLYDREAARIRSILEQRVVRLEHAGSTSVPALAAKPIIDIVLEVPDSADEAAYVPDLEAGGYVLRIREPDWFEHRLFKGPDTNVNLHVFSASTTETDRMLVFRDWLRTNAADRGLYAAAKRELAGRDWKYRQQYADAKTAVIREIMSRAEADRR